MGGNSRNVRSSVSHRNGQIRDRRSGCDVGVCERNDERVDDDDCDGCASPHHANASTTTSISISAIYLNLFFSIFLLLSLLSHSLLLNREFLPIRARSPAGWCSSRL